MPLKKERVDLITQNIGKSKILILGDIMLDEYLFGNVNRISPEAPVPVVEIDSDNLLLGGAANVASNIRTLGDEAIMIGTVGADEASVKLSQLLKSRQISSEFLVTDNSRQTTIKTRIIANNQQIVRADRENRHELDDVIQNKVFNIFKSAVVFNFDLTAKMLRGTGKTFVVSA